jgi:hypothetical protein
LGISAPRVLCTGAIFTMTFIEPDLVDTNVLIYALDAEA